VPTFIGQLRFKGPSKPSGKAELGVARSARALTDVHGGRILSIYWTEGEVDILVTVEGKNEDQATTIFRELEDQEKVDIRIIRALTEGEKERLIPDKSV
tara:strand:- start:87 stop:383 length:297 start_codon:yes stop_codon:yes gene_type:complete